MLRRCVQSVLAVATISASAAAAAQATEVAADTTPTEVYREVQSVARDIEHLRLYMGWPANTQAPIDVSGVLFQISADAIHLAGAAAMIPCSKPSQREAVAPRDQSMANPDLV